MTQYVRQGFTGSIPKVIVGVIFLLIGIFILGISIFSSFVFSKYIENTAVAIENTVDEYGDSVAILQYEVGGKVYKEEGFPGVEYEIGEKVTITYNPDNPSQINIGEKNNTPSLIFGGVIMLFGFLALSSGIKSFKNNDVLISSQTNVSNRRPDEFTNGMENRETGIYFDNEK